MTGLVILGNGFEISEAIVPIDYYFRSGIKMVKASVYNTKEVTSQEGVTILADVLLDDVNLDIYDFLFIPGGKAAFNVLDKISKIDDIIHYFVAKNKLVTAICAAPFLIGRLGYFDGLNYTCFPSFENYIEKGNYLKNKGVVVEKGFITAKSVHYASEFALEVIKYLLGEDVAKNTFLQVKGEL